MTMYFQFGKILFIDTLLDKQHNIISWTISVDIYHRVSGTMYTRFSLWVRGWMECKFSVNCNLHSLRILIMALNFVSWTLYMNISKGSVVKNQLLDVKIHWFLRCNKSLKKRQIVVIVLSIPFWLYLKYTRTGAKIYRFIKTSSANSGSFFLTPG